MTWKVWAKAKEVHAVLLAANPFLFSTEKPVPFKLGIYHEIRARFPELKGRDVEAVMWWLTNRRSYLAACSTPGMLRFGLDGLAFGVVNEKEALHAQMTFDTVNAKRTNKWVDINTPPQPRAEAA